MVSAYYTCNLLPTQLVSQCGYAPRWLGMYAQDSGSTARRREALGVHPMTCPYVTRLVAAADALLESAAAEDCLLVPAGCDAMRRMGDLLAAAYPGRVFSLPMPRSSGEEAVAMLAADLLRLEDWLLGRLPTSPADGGALPAAEAQATRQHVAAEPARARGIPAGQQAATRVTTTVEPATARAITTAEPPAVEYPSPPRPGGVFVVAGPLSDDSLLRLVEQLGAWIAGFESCTSPDRWKPLAALAVAGLGAGGKAQASVSVEPAAKPNDSDATEGTSDGRASALEGYRRLAVEMLATGVCPRRSTAERREHLRRRLDSTKPSSVIYARQSFCDPGAYDALLVSALAQERGLPYLEIEVGFPFEAGGQLRTRVEAFLEAQLLDDDLLDDDEIVGDEAIAAEDEIAGGTGISGGAGISGGTGVRGGAGSSTGVSLDADASADAED